VRPPRLSAYRATDSANSGSRGHRLRRMIELGKSGLAASDEKEIQDTNKKLAGRD
jgi:hypothetical protein